MQIRNALRQSQLAALDAQLLMLHALGKDSQDRTWLIAHAEQRLTPEQHTRFFALCQSRLAGVPVAYLLGCKEFWGLRLQVTPAVLIPRPETETLVAWALALDLPRQASVLDLGTGSGAIALALKHERPQWQVCASDTSQEALAVAQRNAHQLGLQIDLVHSHWFAGVQGFFDLIVSNPPYIAQGDAHLEALRHEPELALTSGGKGLDALQEIMTIAPAFLHPDAFLLVEHGFDQSEAVRHGFAVQGFKAIAQRCDLAGHVRATGGQNGSS